jgi:UPF0176 protein
MEPSVPKKPRPTYSIILFYNYRSTPDGTPVPPMDIPAFCQAHKELCTSLHLTGRVLIANEGINGTLATTNRAQLDQYTNYLLKHPLFTLVEADFKRSTSTFEPFPDLFIKPVKEIISTGGLIPVPLPGQGGTHLTPHEFHAKLTDTTTAKETVVLDIRNHTEYMVGHFKNAIDPNCRTFAEFPRYLTQKAAELKDKTVLMYCTGGVRCEKASYHLKQLGVEEVYQLKGGVHKYLEAFPQGGEWNGKNFVFDKRVSEVFGCCCGVGVLRTLHTIH